MESIPQYTKCNETIYDFGKVLIVCCLLIAGDREVFAWGRCDYGQLGLVTEGRSLWDHVPRIVPHLHGVKQVHA